ncbi:hypothetical protein I4U23_000490 [Adineta vaga]|nr:hypothetical protein I4U23_000490 [Adineta vaga]
MSATVISIDFLCLIFIFSGYQIQSAEVPYDTVVCFGDSHSDTGNVYNLSEFKWPPVPPYYQGRFSNGPIWIEKLGISTLINYAYGGATTDNTLVTGVTMTSNIVPGVRQQISTYKNLTDLTKINFNRTLYVIWAGSNDYFFNINLSPYIVVNSLTNSIDDLIQIGAKHFLIFNEPPFEVYPYVMMLNMSIYMKALTLAHNNNLSNIIQSTYRNITCHFYDTHSLITNILNNPLKYGINSTKNCCWNTLSGIVNISCTTTDTYLFIDEYHFTTRIHQFIADNVRQLFSTSNKTTKHFHSISILLWYICSSIVCLWKKYCCM